MTLQTKKKEVVKLLDISIPSNILDVLLGYLLYYPQMDKEVATSIYYLFIKINRSLYIDNIYLELKFDLILFVSELIVKKNITSNKLIEGAIETKFITEYLEELDEVLDVCHDIVNPDNFNDNDANYMIDYINEKMMYIAIYEEKSNLEHLIHKLNVNDVENFGEFGENFKNLLQKITKDISRSVKDSDNNYISGTEKHNDSLKKTIDDMNNKSNVIKTGITIHNQQMSEGGYVPGEVYLYVAPTQGGKSLILLQTIRWYLLYNKGIQTRNPRKKPIAVYITLENNMKQTNARLFNTFFDEDFRKGKKYNDFTSEEVQQMYIEHGWTDPEQPYAIYYHKNKTLSSNDIELIIDNLEEQNYEVKLVAVDYVKRLKPNEPTQELRIALGEIVNDLMTLAQTKNVPIVTATQLNREAVGKLEEAAKKAQNNIILDIDSSKIGESGLMLENTSFCFLMYREYSKSTNKRYLTINRVKCRDESQTDQNYFAIPYTSPTSLIVEEDYGKKKMNHIINVGDGLIDYNSESNNKSKTRTTRNLRKDSISEDKTILYQSMSDEKNFE